MLSEQLLNELHKLNRTEKLHIVQILVNELVVEETPLQLGAQYEVWSPYDAFEAARTLQLMLRNKGQILKCKNGSNIE